MAAKQKAAKKSAPMPKPEPKDGDVQLNEPEPAPKPVAPTVEEALDKLEEIEAEAAAAPAPTHTIPETPDLRQGLRGKLWFKAIRAGQATLEDALPYYEAVVNDSHAHLAFSGNLQDLLTEHPGLAYFYRSILTDAQQVRRYLEMKAEQVEAEKYKWLMTSEEAATEYGKLKTTEASKFAKADEAVLSLQDQVRVMANIEHHLDNVALGFQDRGIMLNRVVDVRKAGHEEVFIDSRVETDNR